MAGFGVPLRHIVIPAEAGIQRSLRNGGSAAWTPASAGVTKEVRDALNHLSWPGTWANGLDPRIGRTIYEVRRQNAGGVAGTWTGHDRNGARPAFCKNSIVDRDKCYHPERKAIRVA